MKTIKEYQCEICNRRYMIEGEARRCEARGRPDLAAVRVPIGMVYLLGRHANDGRYEDLYAGITFAVAGIQASTRPHYLVTTAWAARDNNINGDSLPPDGALCPGPDLLDNGAPRFILPPDPSHPTYGRLVTALRAVGIEVTCWDGERAVPEEEFLATLNGERPPGEAATARMRCHGCGSPVSTPVPKNTVVRAWIECPECIADKEDGDA